jgi:hypothetical protein
MTAMRLKQNPYMSLGDFFKGLSVNDLTVLIAMTELMNDNEDILGDIIVLTEMLTRAEGVDNPTDAECSANVNYFVVVINAISLERKGIIDVQYQNLSFGSEMGDLTMASLRTK